MNIVAIVIPIYKIELSPDEEISLNQCFRILVNHPIIAIKPRSLNISNITDKYRFDSMITFDDSFFSGIHGYNKLMTSKEFYSSFLSFKYILIHQLDAFVFEDSLEQWCSKNYDYIGAPWLWDKEYPSKLAKLIFSIKQYFYIKINKKAKETGLPVNKQFRNKVGNGGLSLRKVRKFHDLIESNKHIIEFYNNSSLQHHFYNEDVFWSIEVNRWSRNLRIPKCEIAARFALENELERGMALTKGALPFGCHDWDNNKDFWRSYFRHYGYKI